MIPYLLMIFLYALVAVVMAAQASFADFGILDWFNGMKWLRLHFVTLGMLVESFFGVMPLLTAKHYGLPRPDTRWDIWASLNVGIVLLLIGIPLTSRVPIIAGGTLVFIATILLMVQLGKMRSGTGSESSAGRKFYIAGMAYFLFGVLVGTGLFVDWADALLIIGNPTEVHIHSNLWGMMSLVFAGLLVDLYPIWAKRLLRSGSIQPLASPKSITRIFWLMTAGSFGLIFGPWFDTLYLTGTGLVLHFIASMWLLYNVIKPLRDSKEKISIGMWHLLISYFWLFGPIFIAPLIALFAPLPEDVIGAGAPQALVYGWTLQFGMAVIPYFFQRFFFNDENAELGGTKVSLILVNLGGVFLWASIFIGSMQGTLHGMAYLTWAIALVPVVIDLWKKVKEGMRGVETAVS